MTVVRVLAFAAVMLASGSATAQMPPAAGAQMPDPKAMSGIPLPTSDLPPGTLTVRVVLGAPDKPIAGVTVEITGGVRKETGENGRVELQDIRLPTNGGVRVMLVATDPELEQRAARDRKLAEGPAQRGTVVIGGDSRFVFEFGDQGLNVFNLLQISNTARVPIDTGGALVFELPGAAEQAALLEGSSKLATAAGKRIEVKGPFPPGTTMVQFAYTMPYSGDSVTVRQVMPAQLAQVTVIAQKLGATHLTSPQMTQHGEREANGQTFILGQGPAVAAGGAVEFAFSGLPHTVTWPRNLALSLVVLILVVGAFYSIRRSPQAAGGTERKRLEARREKLFAELTALEDSHRAGRVDPVHYTARRQQLIASLERVYAALDEEAAA
jgi:hypothetical protein